MLMKAVCVTPERDLQLRDIPLPDSPPPGYLLVDIEAAAINHGDKTFLKAPQAAGNATATRVQDVWGHSAAGRVVAVGAGVPAGYKGRRVAIYRSLQREQPMLGLWCERAQLPYLTCLRLPKHLSARAYAGSLVNVMTAYAFLEQVSAEGHRGVIATAGHSATGLALAALARRKRLPLILMVRTAAVKAELAEQGFDHVIVSEGGFLSELAALAAAQRTTAVFDGVGGSLISDIAPILPANSTIYFYGFLAGAAPITLTSGLFMMKSLTLKRFSNFESPTVSDPQKLAAALEDLESCIQDLLFQTRVGREFRLDEFDAAMSYEAVPGAKAVFIP
jgi:NADPH:quinone reductase